MFMKVFVISYGGRTGSTWCTNALGTSSEVINHGEPFCSTDYRNIKPFWNLEDAAERIESLYVPNKINVYKIFCMHLGVLPQLIDLVQAETFFLIRTNSLARASSDEISRRTRVYHTSKNDVVPPKLRFNRYAFVGRVSQELVINDLFQRSFPGAFVIRYETLFRDTYLVSRLLGIDVDLNNATDTVRLNTKSIIDRYHQEDHQQVIDAITDLGYPEWVYEETDIPD